MVLMLPDKKLSPLKYKAEDWPDGTRTELLPLEGSLTKRSVSGSMVGKTAENTGKEEEDKERKEVGKRMKDGVAM